MSILIRGIEMPTNCVECRFCDNDAMCTVLGEDLFDHVQAKVADHLRYLPDDWKCDICPLVPVPPHGDLIDRDALLSQYCGVILTAKVDYAEGLRDAIKDIQDAPTIIEAEEGET